MSFPADMKYTKNHEYVKPMADGTALVGITSYAQEALGDVVFVQLPEVGTKLEAGEEFGTVESVKTVAECYLPVSGEVIEINSALEANPELVNEDAHGKGWMLKIKVTGDLSSLMDVTAYEAHVASEAH